MKHTWNENGHEYFVTDEDTVQSQGMGWEYRSPASYEWEALYPGSTFDTFLLYRKKLETPEEKLIREQREKGYCCFKVTKHAMPKNGKGEGWEYFSSRWKTPNYSIFYAGNIYRKKREDIKAEYDALQRKRKEAKERVTDEWIDDVIGTYNNGGWFFSPYIDNYIVAVKELKHRREQEKDS